MPQKKKKPPYKQALSKNKKQTQAVSTKTGEETEARENKKRKLLYLGGVLLITLILYIPSLFNDFIVNWDDGGYIHEHELVHELNAENIGKIFHPLTFYKGNYHPLTTFFYAVEYSLVGENAFLYHLNNLIFHLLNVWLVFWLVRLLSKRTELAAFVALFFGIHPMHVESVAWISERKDVLYAFFFLLAAISYYFYLTREEKKTRNYLLAVVFFFLSLLSKSAAVALPGVLLLIDYLIRRKLSFKLLLDKIPFIILSLTFGILAVMSQDEKGAIQDLGPLYTPVERVFLVSHNIVMYLYKMFVPTGLAAMYPYPPHIDGHIPVLFYICGGIVLLMAAVLIWTKRFGRMYIFGMLFFLVTIALVLQALPVGGAIMAERYTYIPYIGSFFMIGWTYSQVWRAREGLLRKLKPFVHILVAAFAIFCFVLSWQRISHWKNGEVLFTELIKTYPNLPFGYNNRGYMYYRWHENHARAEADFSKAISIDPTYYQAWGNRGVLYYNTQRYEEAIRDFSEALKLKPDDEGSLIGRANTYSTVQKFDLALPDYNNYLPLKPDDAKAWMWRGTALFNLGKTEEAMADFEHAHLLKMNVKANERPAFEAEVIYWKGLVLVRKLEYEKALGLFNQSISMNPDRAETYGWRGIAHYHLKHLPEAIADYTKAIELNPNDAPSFVNRAIAYNDTGRYKEAFADLNAAGKMNYPLNKEFFFKVMKAAGM